MSHGAVPGFVPARYAGRHRCVPDLVPAAPDAVRLQAVVGTNRVVIGASADAERGVAVGFAAIDNLVKGAAGQAVQNANLLLGLDQSLGLDVSGSMP